jgi:hypothetical protein
MKHFAAAVASGIVAAVETCEDLSAGNETTCSAV